MKFKLIATLFCAGFLSLVPQSSIAKKQHYTAKHGLPHPMITALAFQQDRIWVGSNQGLAVKKTTELVFTVFQNFNSGKIISIVPQKSKAIIASTNGLYKVEAKQQSSIALRLPYQITPDQITCLKRSPNKSLWLGTTQGLYTSRETNLQWRSISLPTPSKHIHHISFSGSLMFVSTQDQTLPIYDTHLNQWITALPLKTTVPVTALTHYGTTFYLGTHGQGIHQFSWQLQKSQKRFPAKKSNAFIHASIQNGETAWFGTFNRLIKINQKTGDLQEIPLTFPQPSSVNCFALSSTELYIGTEFGLLVHSLKKPALSFSINQSVCLNPKQILKLTGIAQQTIKQNLSLDFANQTLGTIWFKENLHLNAITQQGSFSGQWNITGLPDKNNFYLLRATCIDNQSRRNSTILPVLIASTKPTITFNRKSEAHQEGLSSFTGTFNTPFVKTIKVSPGDMPAEITKQKNTFRSTASLKPGTNHVQVVLQDWFKRQTEDQMIVTVAQQPSEEAVIVKAGKKKGEEIIVLSEALVFDLGQAEIKPTGMNALMKIADYMQRDRTVLATIFGHTDNLPIDNQRFHSNAELSKSRAQAVFQYLSSKENLSPDRFTILGQGATQPIADNNTEIGRRKNRRVEIVLKKVE